MHPLHDVWMVIKDIQTFKSTCLQIFFICSNCNIIRKNVFIIVSIIISNLTFCKLRFTVWLNNNYIFFNHKVFGSCIYSGTIFICVTAKLCNKTSFMTLSECLEIRNRKSQVQIASVKQHWSRWKMCYSIWVCGKLINTWLNDTPSFCILGVVAVFKSGVYRIYR